MKIHTVLLIFLTSACASPVVFDQPYPKKEASLSALPDRIQGIYMCESDGTIVGINDQTIYVMDINTFEESIEKINERETCTLIGNEIYFGEIQECVPVEFITEDSVTGQFFTIDTLFHINHQNVARMYKGSIVLSKEVSKHEWVISILSQDSYDNLLYRAINENSELEELASITPMKQIGVDRNSEPIYKIEPSKKAFVQLFENREIFIVCEYLKRVNLEEFPYFMF